MSTTKILRSCPKKSCNSNLGFFVLCEHRYPRRVHRSDFNCCPFSFSSLNGSSRLSVISMNGFFDHACTGTSLALISKSCVLQATSVAAQVCTDMDLFVSQLQSASQTCAVSEVAEDKKMKFADASSVLDVVTNRSYMFAAAGLEQCACHVSHKNTDDYSSSTGIGILCSPFFCSLSIDCAVLSLFQDLPITKHVSIYEDSHLTHAPWCDLLWGCSFYG